MQEKLTPLPVVVVVVVIIRRHVRNNPHPRNQCSRRYPTAARMQLVMEQKTWRCCVLYTCQQAIASTVPARSRRRSRELANFSQGWRFKRPRFVPNQTDCSRRRRGILSIFTVKTLRGSTCLVSSRVTITKRGDGEGKY